MRLQEFQNYIDSKRRKNYKRNLIGGMTAGAASGLAAGIMLAPRSGKASRHKLKRKAINTLEKSKDKASEIKEEVEEKAIDAKDSVKSKVSKD